MIWSFLIIGLATGYTLFFIVVAWGIWRLPRTQTVSHPVKVSIIVPCRNEEKDIERCVDALLEQDYPVELTEILLVDDQSADQTGQIIDRYAREHAHIKALSTANAQATHLRAKARVIAYGATQARGDWLFIVDADTRVPAQWLGHMLYGVKEEDGMLGGLIMTEESGYWSVSGLEKVSLAYTQPITVGLSGWGQPAICSGPNMAIRRSVYEAHGGLEKVDFDIAEDLALISIVLKAGKKIRFHGSPETVGYLISVPTLKHLFSQQRRWVTGGFEQGWELKAGLAFVFSYHFVYSWVMLLGWLVAPSATLIAVLAKLLTDFGVMLALKTKMKIPRLLRFWPLMFLYSSLAFIWIPISLAFSAKVRWKGEGYEVKY